MYLSDVLGTKYLTDDYEADLSFLLTKYYACKRAGTRFTENIFEKKIAEAINRALEAGIMELDLNDCRFTAKVWDVMARTKEHQDSVKLLDSGDAHREQFIREYMAFVDTTKDLQKLSSLPAKPKDIADLANWVGTLQGGVVYQLFTEEYTKNPAFLLVINLLAPHVMIETRNRPLISYAKRVFSEYMLDSCTSFYYLYGTQEEFLEAELGGDGKIHIPNIGEFDKETFIRKFLCMPHFVGNSTVSFSKAPASLKRALKDIMKDVKAYLDERPITIETYFPLKEVYTT